MTKQEIEGETSRVGGSGRLPAYPLQQGSTVQEQVVQPATGHSGDLQRQSSSADFQIYARPWSAAAMTGHILKSDS